MPEQVRRIPAYVCFALEVRHLVSAGLFDDGGRRDYVPIPDPRDVSRDERLPVDVRIIGPGKAIVVLDGQVVEAVSRPGLNGREFWEFVCPGCRRACRKFYRPLGVDGFKCGECWRIARPSRSPRWRGATGEEVARHLARALVEMGGRP